MLTQCIPILTVSIVVAALTGCLAASSSTRIDPPSGAKGGSKGVSTSVYGFLSAGEYPGYGLYSYALFPRESQRSRDFVVFLVQTTRFSNEATIARERLNIIYLPIKSGDLFTPDVRSYGLPPENEVIENFVYEQYDYAYANSTLALICDRPADVVKTLCASDYSSRGPYLLTYTAPISGLLQLPPPYLFLDLSTVPPAAFPEFIGAYKAQVKRPNYTDARLLNTFRLDVLKILTSAAEHIGPIAHAVAHYFHLIEKESIQAVPASTGSGGRRPPD